jgi:hypothetical protein
LGGQVGISALASSADRWAISLVSAEARSAAGGLLAFGEKRALAGVAARAEGDGPLVGAGLVAIGQGIRARSFSVVAAGGWGEGAKARALVWGDAEGKGAKGYGFGNAILAAGRALRVGARKAGGRKAASVLISAGSPDR